MDYIDGMLIPVPTAARDEYRAHELKWWPSFKELGAKRIMVAWGDDVPAGKYTDFQRAVDLKPDETVVFCWIVWPDRATRDAAHRAMEARAANDPSMTAAGMPFDGKRLVFGGFQPIIDEG